MKFVKKVWDSFADFMVGWADGIGRARAAAELSRQGRYEEARRLMQD
jgi:hypothetical protein